MIAVTAALAAVRAFRPSPSLVILLVAAALVAAGGLGAWRAAAVIERALRASVADGKAIATAQYEAEIARSNALVEKARADQAITAAAADAQAARDKAKIEETLSELEKANAALPNADRGGLDRDRVRLLRQAR